MWDFVAQVQKTRIQKVDDESDGDKDLELEEADNFDDAASETDSDDSERTTSIDQLLASHARDRKSVV